jgi:hypothetical protein
MSSTTRIPVPSEKAHLLRDIAAYPQPLLQWFVDVLDNYAYCDWKAIGQPEAVEDASRRVAVVLDGFREQATHGIPEALLELHRSVWEAQAARRSGAEDEAEADDSPDSKEYLPAGWPVWGPAEREAYRSEQAAWKRFDAICRQAATTNGRFSLKLNDDIQAAASAVYGAEQDRTRALLRRWRPDLADLIELAFLEESEREDNLHLAS